MERDLRRASCRGGWAGPWDGRNARVCVRGFGNRGDHEGGVGLVVPVYKGMP